MPRRRGATALVLLAFGVPLAVSLDPPSVGGTPAAACSGTAYVAAAPTVFDEGPPPKLASNARTLVYRDARSINAAAPKETDAYQVLVDGRAMIGKPRAILPGLFAVEPAEPLRPGASVAVAWQDGTPKPTARYTVGAAKDETPPVMTGGTTLTAIEGRTSCDATRFGVKVPITITDESPVVVAAWQGARAEGDPLAYARWIPGSDAVELRLPGPAPELTLVAIDAAGNRSGSRVARLVGEPGAKDDAPPAGAPAMRERGTRRRAGCRR